MSASEDPHQELRMLTRALRSTLRRRGAFGQRQTPRHPDPPVRALPEAPLAGGSTQDAPLKGPIQGAPPEAPAQAGQCPDLASLREAVARCTSCALHSSRTQTVFMDGEGPRGVMFVGEAPGYHEDQQGVPFVGRAGQLLTDIIEKGMGLRRPEVCIANVLKCRPPQNRDPSGEEKATCTPWLDRQIELVRPKILIALGRHAAGHLLATDSSLSRLRGRVHRRGDCKVVVTYHPAYLLRNPRDKGECWKDIQLAMAEIGLEPPPRG